MDDMPKYEPRKRQIQTTEQDEKRIEFLTKKTGHSFTVLVRLGLEELERKYAE